MFELKIIENVTFELTVSNKKCYFVYMRQSVRKLKEWISRENLTYVEASDRLNISKQTLWRALRGDVLSRKNIQNIYEKTNSYVNPIDWIEDFKDAA